MRFVPNRRRHEGGAIPTLTGTRLLAFLAPCTALLYYFANPERHSPFDYTMRVAEALLHGHLGVTELPPSWLNEMIPHQGAYYSAFPLGAVLSMIPVALLKMAGLVTAYPSAGIAAIQAGGIVLFCFGLTSLYGDRYERRILLTLFPVFGTWTFCNLAFGGAWQIALGFALLGQVGALYFVLVDRRPLAAGLLFAIACGNRTEVILAAPVFLYLLLRSPGGPACEGERLASPPTPCEAPVTGLAARLAGRLTRTCRAQASSALRFLVIPVMLAACTLAYNYERFGSVQDFGYSRIPGVLSEAGYTHGVFSLKAIAINSRAMVLGGWKRVRHYPYLVPDGFGGSIFLSCPLLLLLFRPGARRRDSAMRWCCWIAIIALTLVLWTHGNPGGWQYSYRYAIELLPWMFMLLLEADWRSRLWIEPALFGLSVSISIWATYLFLWTQYVRP